MKASIFTDEEQLITKAVDVLIKELGPVEASRFFDLAEEEPHGIGQTSSTLASAVTARRVL